MSAIDSSQVKKITELSTASSFIGDEALPSQKGDSAYKIPLGKVGGFAVKGTCSTAAGTKNKVVTLTNYTDSAVPSQISVSFTNANTYGDCTLSSPTYPRLILKNSSNVTIATLNVCDARGHTAGTGCWNAGDKMRFNIDLNSSNTGDALIDNSDIRQQTSTMTIKADGQIVIYGLGRITAPADNTYDVLIQFPVSLSTIRSLSADAAFATPNGASFVSYAIKKDSVNGDGFRFVGKNTYSSDLSESVYYTAIGTIS